MAPDFLVATIAKRKVCWNVLTFTGIWIQNVAKRKMLSDYHEGLKPALMNGVQGFKNLEVLNWYTDTDSCVISITAPSYSKCSTILKLSSIYMAIQKYCDFSPFLKEPGNVFWSEIRASMTPGEFLHFVRRVKTLAGETGYWKMETGIGKRNQAMTLFYSIRSKVYLCLSIIDNGDENEPSVDFKRAMKGGVLKSRMRNLTIDDYLEMGKLEQSGDRLESDMRKLQSRHWRMYFIHLSRYRPTIFDRKRYLLDDHYSVPFGFLAAPDSSSDH